MAKKIVLIGLHPDVVDFSTRPDLSADTLMSRLNSEIASLEAAGFSADLLLIDDGETAEEVTRSALSSATYNCVVIGAGVRKTDAHFLLFEKLINIFHELAPGARIAFNTRPDDTAAAVQRWMTP